MDEQKNGEVHMTIVAINYTLSIMSGKWKWLIVGALSHHGVMRYGELKSLLAKCSHKMLSQQLRELEQDAMIVRTAYNEIPPKVEYSISEKGRGLMPILKEMGNWGFGYMEYDPAESELYALDATGNKRKKTDGANSKKGKAIRRSQK